MKKIYQKPEFQIICQNQANAKFFVASGFGNQEQGESNPGMESGASFTQETTDSGEDEDTFSF